MLLGEHAVLHNRCCLVCAVNQRITLTVIPRTDSLICIRSSLGEFVSDLSCLSIEPKFRFVLMCIKKYYSSSTGFELNISSEFSDLVGLGSSAAVTAAMCGALLAMQADFDAEKVFHHGMAVIRDVQGTGSGADLASSVFGGILKYRQHPLSIEPVPGTFSLTLVYSGEKMATTEVIRLVNNRRKKLPELYDDVYDMMNKSVLQAVEAIKQENWKKFGHIMNFNQGLMDAIGVNNRELAEINFLLRKDKNILGSKISGSGLGDCVVGLGAAQIKDIPYPVFPLEISSKGVSLEQT